MCVNSDKTLYHGRIYLFDKYFDTYNSPSSRECVHFFLVENKLSISLHFQSRNAQLNYDALCVILRIKIK